MHSESLQMRNHSIIQNFLFCITSPSTPTALEWIFQKVCFRHLLTRCRWKNITSRNTYKWTQVLKGRRFILFANDDKQLREIDPGSDLYPFMVAARTCDLSAVCSLMRRNPSLTCQSKPLRRGRKQSRNRGKNDMNFLLLNIFDMSDPAALQDKSFSIKR